MRQKIYTLFPSSLDGKVYTISATYIQQLEILMSPTQSDKLCTYILYIYVYVYIHIGAHIMCVCVW